MNESNLQFANFWNQEFEQCVESQMIQVMKMKMHKHQIESIVSLARSKTMKGSQSRENTINQKSESRAE
jgi:hypothetical protein